MKWFWCFVIIQTVFAVPPFGKYFLRSTKLCHQWSCVNNKLNLSDSLPSRDEFTPILKSLLPEGPWQETVEPVLNICYGEPSRRYTNTCPGQGLMHCVIDSLIQNCPESSLRKDDVCAPVTSLAGLKFMFSQSRYENLEKNLPTERRPAWFLKNYFSSKCCNLPELFNNVMLAECGFMNLMHYYTHMPRNEDPQLPRFQNHVHVNTYGQSKETVKIVNINQNEIQPTTENDFTSISEEDFDPLECCDLSSFIEPTWRSECNFQLSWNDIHRLQIKDKIQSTTVPVQTETIYHDVKVVPLSCKKQSCVFRKLNILSQNGSVNVDFFSKLLDNMTNVHPEWSKAKARVVTQCLSKPLNHYVEDCEINKILSCTFDVLSENCPHAKTVDPCKRTHIMREGLTCQISASKYRPKNRRQFCGLPNLVNHEILSECSVNSLSHMEYVPEAVVSRKTVHDLWRGRKYMCKELTDSTKCLLNKMSVLNKYNFMDYFKMKSKIQAFTADASWAPLSQVYTNSFATMPLYGEHCSSPKKLLNTLDPLIMTCPLSKRIQTAQCERLFTKMSNSPPLKTNWITNIKLDQIWRHFQHVNLTHKDIPELKITKYTTEKSIKNVTKKYDLLNSNVIPPVRVMDIKPQTLSRPKPLVILPVYLRNKGKGSFSVQPYRGLLRSEPFALHNSIAMTHGGEKKLV